MKMLLIYDEENAASRIRPFLEKMNLAVENFPAKPADGKGEIARNAAAAFSPPPEPGEGEEAPACALIVAALPEWQFGFFAGFSLGSGRPFPVYGENAIAAAPRDLAFCFPPLKTEAALKEYVEAEKAAILKREAAGSIRKAREELLQKGVSVTEESLVNCVSTGGAAEVSLFFAAGFSPNARDKAGVPLLNLSARTGNREMLRLLIRQGADVDILAADRGSSALIDSAIAKRQNLAEDLLEAGADVNIRSKAGQSALIVAVGAGDEAMAELLLKAGADPDVIDSLGVSARKYANLFHQQNMMAVFEAYPSAKAV